MKKTNMVSALNSLGIILLFFNTACIKEETPIARHESGNVSISSVNLMPDYRFQVFYSLEKDSVISQNLKNDWDLGFESSPEGFHIILNESKAMFALEMKNTNFDAVQDTIGFNGAKRWDVSSGNLDSTAIGDWRGKQSVYLIDRGYGLSGNHLGFYKINLLQVDASSYSVRFSDVNGTQETKLSIPKDSTFNFTFFTFADGGKLVSIEPPKATWDLCFTQYLHIFQNPISPYIVTGCLLNRYHTIATVDSLKSFPEIKFDQISDNSLYNRINMVGYNWKAYANGTYTTRSELNYIIKTNKGVYYKLHFIDFYSSSGQKGSPKWEFQRM